MLLLLLFLELCYYFKRLIWYVQLKTGFGMKASIDMLCCFCYSDPCNIDNGGCDIHSTCDVCSLWLLKTGFKKPHISAKMFFSISVFIMKFKKFQNFKSRFLLAKRWWQDDFHVADQLFNWLVICASFHVI